MLARDIAPGREYVYVNAIPAWAQGQRYRVLRFIWDVPTYQRKVLIEPLTGRDKGVWFCCSVANFVVRYEPAPDQDMGTAGYHGDELMALEDRIPW